MKAHCVMQESCERGNCAVSLGVIIGGVKFRAVDLGLWCTCFCIDVDEGSLCYERGDERGSCAVGLGVIIGAVKFMVYTCFRNAVEEGSLCYVGGDLRIG